MSKSQFIYSCPENSKNCTSTIGEIMREIDYSSIEAIGNGFLAKEKVLERADAFVDRHKSWGNQTAVAAVYTVLTEIAELELKKANPYRGVVCKGASMILNRCTAHIE